MPDEESELARKALSIAAALASADPGEKAEARRMGPSGAPIFWRQVARLGIGQGQEERWLFFTRLVALCTPASRDTSIHDKARRLGGVLAEAKFSEQRLARLLAARGGTRDDALERAVRMLAHKVPGLDVVDLARAVFDPDDSGRIARAYYTHLDHAKSEEPDNV